MTGSSRYCTSETSFFSRHREAAAKRTEDLEEGRRRFLEGFYPYTPPPPSSMRKSCFSKSDALVVVDDDASIMTTTTTVGVSSSSCRNSNRKSTNLKVKRRKNNKDGGVEMWGSRSLEESRRCRRRSRETKLSEMMESRRDDRINEEEETTCLLLGTCRDSPILILDDDDDDDKNILITNSSKVQTTLLPTTPSTFSSFLLPRHSTAWRNSRCWRANGWETVQRANLYRGSDVLSPVVVDGVDLCRHHGRQGRLSLRGLENAVAFFVHRGHATVVAVPTWLPCLPFEGPHVLETFEENLQEAIDVVLALDEDGLLYRLPDDPQNKRDNSLHLTTSDVINLARLCRQQDAILCTNNSTMFAALHRRKGATREVESDLYAYVQHRQLMYSFDVDHFCPCHDTGRGGPLAEDLLVRCC